MKRLLALAACILCISTAYVGAELIPVTPGYPLITYNSGGTLIYNAGTNILVVDATPLAFRQDLMSAPAFVAPTGAPPERKVSIIAVIDESGTPATGFIVVTGAIDTDNDLTPDYEDVLISGELLDFGFLNSGALPVAQPPETRRGKLSKSPPRTPIQDDADAMSTDMDDGMQTAQLGTPTDQFDFRFKVTGGSMAGLYHLKDLAVTLTSENSSFDDDFTTGFMGGAKGVLGPIDSVLGACCLKKGECLEAISVDECDAVHGQFLGEASECGPDSDGDGNADTCDLCPGFDDYADCDGDKIPDGCEEDCDADGIPDDCEPDCNNDGTPDDCEVGDCDNDGVPDVCEPDCDGNGIPDDCEPDCDNNGTPDACETSDCDADGIPDACEPDCNNDGTPDDCEPDCDNDGVPDGCEPDCDSDGIPDDCEPDCDNDGTPDDCEENCPAPGVTRYRLANHPDGDHQPPPYGMRLDELFDVTPGHDVFSFDFEHPASAMWMDLAPDEIHIFGRAYGGLDIGAGYDPAYQGVAQIDLWYTMGVGLVPVDDDSIVDTANNVNAGSIRVSFGPTPGAAIPLVDERGNYGYSFRFGDEDDDNGHRGFAGLSGWGWVNHSGLPHVAAGDWLFTAVEDDRCISDDCDDDGVPDACEPDCDNDGIPDDCEPDCDNDGTPDDCEEDCDGNGIPDDCESDCAGGGVNVVWDIDNCLSGGADSADFSEFVAAIVGDCTGATIEATTLLPTATGHSCTNDAITGAGGDAMCVKADGDSYFDAGDSDTLAFRITISETQGEVASLTRVSFYERAPSIWVQSNSGGVVASGTNNYPQKFGVRILRDGVEVFRLEDVATSRDWMLRVFDLPNEAAFQVTNAVVVFTVELLSYDRKYCGGSAKIWDLDQFEASVSCCVDNDCDDDGVPNACEPDCDNDGVPDDCEVDSDSNGIPDDCETGACCKSGGLCIETDAGHCATVGGAYLGDGVACETDTCAPDCPGSIHADFNYRNDEGFTCFNSTNCGSEDVSHTSDDVYGACDGNGVSGFAAGPDFSGDLRAWDGGEIRFDYMFFENDWLDSRTGEISIVTPAGTFTQDIIPDFRPNAYQWYTASGEFSAAAFGVDEATWRAGIANVTRI